MQVDLQHKFIKNKANENKTEKKLKSFLVKNNFGLRTIKWNERLCAAVAVIELNSLRGQ